MSANFRRMATTVFRLVAGALALLPVGLAALGWWVGCWWGLGIGAAVGCLISAAGLVGAGMIYAMSQDGGWSVNRGGTVNAV